jgi:prepilin-type N-terminal cleavage/methylation domain-containing protein
MKHKRAFTLIELLVTVAIIAILIGILMPALTAVRSRGRRTACTSNLHQIGVAMRSYLDGNNDIFPDASFMPSYGPSPVGDPPPPIPGQPFQAQPIDGGNVKPIYIAEVLLSHVGGSDKVFACPNDVGTIARPAPNVGKSYFASEKASYEYRTRLLRNTSMAEAKKRYAEFTGKNLNENTFWILRDYDNFHDEAGKQGSRRYVYNDGHVTDYEN